MELLYIIFVIWFMLVQKDDDPCKHPQSYQEGNE